MPPEVAESLEEPPELSASREDFLMDCEEEELRAVFLQLCLRIKHRVVDTDAIQVGDGGWRKGVFRVTSTSWLER